MNTVAPATRRELSSIADRVLNAAVRLWFAVTVTGQWIFVCYIAFLYGGSAARGDWQTWNKVLPHGYTRGDRMGNVTLAIHLLFAAAITFSGALQLIPAVRARFPKFHRWNGRIYVVTALVMAVSGLYLVTSGRNLVGDLPQQIAVGINGLLILVCAVLAWRYAVARDFLTHRRWALRLFLVVNGVWYFRVGLMFWLAINKGPVGFDPVRFQGPFLTFLAFAQFLLPLGVLELYLRTPRRAGAGRRYAMAVTLFVLTAATGVGVVAATIGMWIPRVRTSLDSRKSIVAPLSELIESRGIDEAVKRYHVLKASQPAAYDFDESELNTLGYQLIHKHQFQSAIRILALNVETYPRSGNAYDSLAEACLDGGEKGLAVINYRKSLERNPENQNASDALRKLEAR